MKGLSKKIFNLLIFGVLKRIRTSDLRFRRLLLYPAELSGHMVLPQRFELWTRWLRVSCSTCWATGVYGVPQGIRTLDPLIKSQMLYHWASGAYGTPWEIRTPNLLVRSQMRYPIAPKRHMVAQGRIELPTQRFSVSCSTYWAIEPY